ncbi:cytochrome P450 [Undibacterium flavidum]|uniref:Cytochrome P450 n=1 Tax=Undibacterium flavidum TaxID=2762297 RepID=A0ABR6YB59_9BURK|nr:cytochrome P450 [Undibacterium flavidum]MBC3873868.1 cytochrome P450 [Undibacterium flavidum]
MTVNIREEEFFQNPYPYYAEIRRAGEPLWLPHEQDSTSQGVWLFAHYADALAIFKNNLTISKHIRTVRPSTIQHPFDLHLLHRDGADHLRLRRMIAEFFSLKAIAQLEPIIQQQTDYLIDALIDNFADQQSFDFITEFCDPLPVFVIAHMFGVPQNDMQKVRRWSLILGDSFDSLLVKHTNLDERRTALNEFISYVQYLIQTKRDQPDDSMLSYLLEREGQQLISSEELIGMSLFILFAGHETTINLLGSGASLLLSHPEQWALLQAQPELLPSAIEEMLRFESPEQRTSFRITSEDTEISGFTIPAGQQIGVFIGSANRDPAVFERAEEFDIRRQHNPHLAFGIGIHHCLGKTLSRAEAKIAFATLLKRCPGLVLAESSFTWRKNSFLRSLEKLSVSFA